MATEKTAHATWEGDLMSGKGRLSFGSGSLPEQEMTWSARAEDVEGTSPEELIAGALATCVSMALSHGLAEGGTPPTRLETDATTTFDKTADGFRLTSIKLAVRGEVPGVDDDTFREAAQQAKEGCPVSQALKGNVEIRLDASLVSQTPARSA